MTIATSEPVPIDTSSKTSCTLVLVRHGESEWNKKNLFSGWHDIDLSTQGIEEARLAGARLSSLGISFTEAFTSGLVRAQHTLEIILDKLALPQLSTTKSIALNERDYGELTGLNKADAAQKWGEEQVHIWRRSYDINPPGGESLRDTGARVWPYYIHEILPRALNGGNVLVVAHGNSLRALIMALDGLTPEKIMREELPTGVPIVYKLRLDSTIVEKLQIA